MVSIFCIVLDRVNLCGVGSRGGLSSLMDTDVSSVFVILPIVFVFFYKVHNPTPWNFGKIIKGFAVILMVFDRFCASNIWEGSQK